MSPIPTEPAAPIAAPAVRPPTKGAVALAFTLFLAGAVLRCHDVADLSINGDEIYSVWETRSARKAANATDAWDAWKNRLAMMVMPRPPDPKGIAGQEAWRLRWGYRTNPLCLVINEGAFKLLGATPFAVRLGSLIFGIAALAVLPWMFRPLFGERAALLLLALLAFCPAAIEMSRDARYPSACFFFGGVAAIAAARFARDRRPRDEWICLVGCVLLVLSHLTGVLVAAAIFLHLSLVARGRVALRLLPAAAILALLAWYFGPHGKVGTVIQEGIVDKVRYPWWRLAASLAYNVGPPLIGLGLLAVAAARRIGVRTLAPLIAAAALPALALFWMNRRNDIGPRYFGAIIAAGLVLAACGAEFLFRREHGRRLAAAVVALALLLQVPLLASNAIDGQRYPYAEAARFVHARLEPTDRVVADWSGIVEYYFEEELLDDRHVVEMPNTLAKLDEALREGDRKRAFLIVPRQRGEFAWPGGQQRLRDWLTEHAKPLTLLGHKRFDARLYWFELEIFEVDLVALRLTAP